MNGVTDRLNLLILAGPNGSGKSTIIERLKHGEYFPEIYINPDEAVKGSDFSSIANIEERYIAAMQYCEVLRKNAIEYGLSLAFETVLSHPEKLTFLHESRQKGYMVESVYVTTRDPRINIERVAERHSKGGHDVPRDKIVSRYYKSMYNMLGLFEASNTMTIYDNSDSRPLALLYKYGTRIYLLNREYRGNLLDEYLFPHITNREQYQWFDLTYAETISLIENYRQVSAGLQYFDE